MGWRNTLLLACLASVSAWVRRESWDESKKKKEWRYNSTGNACYVGYFIAYSSVQVDFFSLWRLLSSKVKKWQKSDKHFKLVSLTPIVRLLFMAVRTVPNPHPPPPPLLRYNISNGPYNQYVAEVTGSCSQ